MIKGLMVIASVLLAAEGALDMAKIKGKNRIFTSSTLGWEDMKTGDVPPAHAVPVVKDGPLWCRAKTHATWIAGSVVDGMCRMTFVGRVLDVKEYDVLVSVNDSARVLEAEWDRLTAMPSNGITTPNMLMAISNDNDTVLAGYVSPGKRQAHFVKDGEAHSQDEALILTEDEPVRYEVDRIIRDEDKSQVTDNDVEVSNTTLVNDGDEEKLVSSMVDYVSREIIYWGRVRGTITALASTVTDPSGVKREITWGMDNELDHLEQQKVEYQLPAGTAVHVRLIAVMRKFESPYSALLTAIYSDNVRRSWNIEGLHIHTHLAELRAEFSKPYYLANDTEIEGDFPTSQILLHSTTTTTTTTTTTQAPADSKDNVDSPVSESLATTDGGKQPTGDASSVSRLMPPMLVLSASLLMAANGLFLS
ncbi:protein unzipped-like [Penaeus japonicus]|uniref:protein unzipped-like n=1 Tax=Penaeus japonicus TaxID=27405 RepID=UPI001C710E82|nr:protein unzipped-like [Penaeus japonicus]